jgi:hypothetical protein
MIAIRPSAGITVGKEYQVIKVNEDKTIQVKNDNGIVYNYNPKIFINYPAECPEDEIKINKFIDQQNKTKKNRNKVIEEIYNAPKHYDNSKGSIYKFANDQNLNSYEFDIIKRIIRSRKKGNFREDLEKTKFLIDLYLTEYENI